MNDTMQINYCRVLCLRFFVAVQLCSQTAPISADFVAIHLFKYPLQSLLSVFGLKAASSFREKSAA